MTSNSADAVPVLVVGAGPAGLAAASELAHQGIRCVVVEPRTQVSHARPRAKTTSVRTMEHLRRWGVADALRSAAPIRPSWSQRVTFCQTLMGRRVADVDEAFGLTVGRDDRFSEGGQQVAQPVVEGVLRHHLASQSGVDLRLGHTVVAVRELDDRVVARIRDENGCLYELRSRYVIACDGPSSQLRDAVGATLVGVSDVRKNFNVLVKSPGLDTPLGPAVQYWVVGAERPGVIGRLDFNDTWWAILPGVDAEYGAAHARQLVLELIGADPDIDVLSTDSWTARMLIADRFQSERIFLAGESAHVNPPWGGHGYNTCVADAVNVAWKIGAVEQGWAAPALLSSYEWERRGVVEQTLSTAVHNMRTLPADLRCDAAAILAAKTAEFHSLGLVLGYSYAGSPVVQPGPASAMIDIEHYTASTDPGARLPHTWMPDGTSLFDRLGRGFTLVGPVSGFTVEVAEFAAAAETLGVPITTVENPHTYPWHDEFLLVRPDQHIAWRSGRPQDVDLPLVTGRREGVCS